MQPSVLLAAHQLRYQHPGGLSLVADLTLHAGERVGLLGLNGAGKSTLLQCLAGALRADGGVLEIDGKRQPYPKAAARRLIGHLPDPPPLHPRLTVREILLDAARLYAVPRAQQAEAIRQIMDQCQLQDVARRRIGSLSSGYRKRAGLAQALVHKPRIVLLDEPSAGLDPAQRQLLIDLMRNLGEAHTLLISSHDIDEIRQLCDRVLILHRGRICWQAQRAQWQQQDPAEVLFNLLQHPDRLPEAAL